MALNVIPSEPSGIANTYRIGPEDMQTIRTEDSQTPSSILDRRATAGIGRVGQYANQRVFCERTSRPSAAAIATEPLVSCFVMQVGWIKQRHQDVYVKECDHALSYCLRFVAQPVDNFRRDQPHPSLLEQDGHSVAFARSAIPRRQRATSELR
jgi:hypothetical protein